MDRTLSGVVETQNTLLVLSNKLSKKLEEMTVERGYISYDEYLKDLAKDDFCNGLSAGMNTAITMIVEEVNELNKEFNRLFEERFGGNE